MCVNIPESKKDLGSNGLRSAKVFRYFMGFSKVLGVKSMGVRPRSAKGLKCNTEHGKVDILHHV